MAPPSSRTSTQTGRPEVEALSQARLRLEAQRAALGDRHPDYAVGLNRLALLLIVHDEAAEAEPLLRRALAVQKEALGEHHPDCATTFSSLAGLLWARGDLVGAEPMLRRALEIRWRAFGPDHSRTVASLDRLDELLQVKRDLAARASRPAAVETEAEMNADAHMDGERAGATGEEVPSPAAGSDELSHDLSALSDAFTALGERLEQASRTLREEWTSPPEALVEDLAACRRDFAGLCDRATALAGTLHVDCPPAGDLRGLPDVAALLDEIAGAEIGRAGCEGLRRRALEVLDRVLRLAHVADSDFPALRACQAQALALRDQLAECPWDSLAAEAGPLAESDHPFAHLLALVEDREELDDELAVSLHASIEEAFGPSLADAAVDARLAPSSEHAAPARLDASLTPP